VTDQKAVALWLVEWFSERGEVPGATLEDKLEINYFDAKLIDSLAVVDLIAEIEEKFGVEFADEHFQDRRFAVIGGLWRIIVELAEARSAS
jgi:acyl carrier protein